MHFDNGDELEGMAEGASLPLQRLAEWSYIGECESKRCSGAVGLFDKVHTALQHALHEAGIECPFPTQTLHLQMNSEVAEQISPTVRQY